MKVACKDIHYYDAIQYTGENLEKIIKLLRGHASKMPYTNGGYPVIRIICSEYDYREHRILGDLCVDQYLIFANYGIDVCMIDILDQKDFKKKYFTKEEFESNMNINENGYIYTKRYIQRIM